MSLIPWPMQGGQPYRLAIGDRINYFIRFNAVQVHANGGDETVFIDAAGAIAPRFLLPMSENPSTVPDRLRELLVEQQVLADIVPVENSHPSINTYEVVAKAS